MKIHRRQFLETAALGTAGLLTVREPLYAQPASVAVDPTALVPLGKRLKVSRIGMGTGVQGMMRTSRQIKMGVDKFEQVIGKAYDEGIRYFDMADLYGSHAIVGRALKDKPRDAYTLISKVWLLRGGLPETEREDADVAVKRFLKEYGTDYLDLVQIHCMTKADWPETMRKQMDLLEGLREKGLIRAHGVTCHSIAALEAAAKEPWVDVVHARINPDGAYMDGPAEKVAPVLKKIHDAGKGVIGMKIIGQGRWRNDPAKREASIRYVTGLGTVDVMVVGFERPEEIDNVKELTKQALEAKKTEKEVALLG
jgi:aryl-alcohol dehydrogenase-like predicted oxidoreductase